MSASNCTWRSIGLSLIVVSIGWLDRLGHQACTCLVNPFGVCGKSTSKYVLMSCLDEDTFSPMSRFCIVERGVVCTPGNMQMGPTRMICCEGYPRQLEYHKFPCIKFRALKVTWTNLEVGQQFSELANPGFCFRLRLNACVACLSVSHIHRFKSSIRVAK